MQYLVSVLYMSLFEPEEFKNINIPSSYNKHTGERLNEAVEDIRVVMVDIERLNTVIRNGFEFSFINETDAIKLYEEILPFTRDVETTNEIMEALNVKTESLSEKYMDLKNFLETKYLNVLKKNYEKSISGRRKKAIIRRSRSSNFNHMISDDKINVDESYLSL